MKIERQIRLLEILISRINAGVYVSRPSLKKAIGEVGLQELDIKWAEEKRTRGWRPNEIVEYSNRLRPGLQLYSIALRASYKYNHQKANVAWGKARASLYSALEYLECAIASNQSLRLWIDRDLIKFYLCPEGYNKMYSSKSDIWSLGVCAHLLLTGNYPFDGEKTYMRNVRSGKVTLDKKLNDDSRSFLSMCLTVDPLHRCDIDQMYNSDFLR